MKRYLCRRCGVVRLAPRVRDAGTGYPATNEQAADQPDWPWHCGRPMHLFSEAQYLAARSLPKHLRVAWAASGLRVMVEERPRGAGKVFRGAVRSGKVLVCRAAVWPRQVREAMDPEEEDGRWVYRYPRVGGRPHTRSRSRREPEAEPIYGSPSQEA